MCQHRGLPHTLNQTLHNLAQPTKEEQEKPPDKTVTQNTCSPIIEFVKVCDSVIIVQPWCELPNLLLKCHLPCSTVYFQKSVCLFCVLALVL